MFKTIAWATDGSPSALNALTVAKTLARESSAQLVIIHADVRPVGRVVIAASANHAVSAALHRTAQEIRDEGIETTVMVSSVSSGDVARMIVDLARRAGAGMIVAGNRRQGPLARFFTGDVASRLLRDAPCPVLIVPSRPHTGKSSAAASASSDSAHAQTQRT